jgi:hypothetical protein
MSSEVHLTRAQKWHLARFAVAAVVSSVFFSLPMFLAPAPSAADTSATTSKVKVAEEIAIAGVSEPVAIEHPAETGIPSSNQSVIVVTSSEVARISRPPVATSGRVSARPVQVRAKAQSPETPAQQKLSRRLARFIAGDGKYGSPKPFPTVPSSGS